MKKVSDQAGVSRPRQEQAARRTVRLTVPDARHTDVRKRIAAQIAELDPRDEEDVMSWIEAVSDMKR